MGDPIRIYRQKENLQKSSSQTLFGQKELEYVWKNPQVVQIQVSSNHGAREQVGVINGGLNSTQEYEKIFLE